MKQLLTSLLDSRQWSSQSHNASVQPGPDPLLEWSSSGSPVLSLAVFLLVKVRAKGGKPIKKGFFLKSVTCTDNQQGSRCTRCLWSRWRTINMPIVVSRRLFTPSSWNVFWRLMLPHGNAAERKKNRNLNSLEETPLIENLVNHCTHLIFSFALVADGRFTCCCRK